MASRRDHFENKRILVKNLPPKLAANKLVIYFQKEKHGGNGDVSSVTLPFSANEPKSAVIEFENAKTAASILGKQHQLFGYQLQVLPFPEQEFGQSDIVINMPTLAKINAIQDWQATIQDTTGVSIERRNGDTHIRGQWYQVEAAMNIIKEHVAKFHLTSNTCTTTRETENKPRTHIEEYSISEHMFKYYLLCYPDSIKSITKKFKVSTQYSDEKLYFFTKQSGENLQLRAAVNRFNSLFIAFSQKVRVFKYDYSKFPLTNNERDEAIEAAMENGKVFISCNKTDSANRQIIILALNKEDMREAITTFQTECMPQKNVVLATFKVTGKNFKVTLIHGDFQQQKGDALLSEITDVGRGRVLEHCGHGDMPGIKKLTGDGRTVINSTGSNVMCKWIQNFKVTKGMDGKCDFKKPLTAAIELISTKGYEVVLPVFKENSCGVSSSDYIGMVASAIKSVKENTKLMQIYIVHSNLKEAINIQRFLTSTKKFSLLQKSDIEGINAQGGNTSEEDVCSICLEELSGAVSMRTLACKHTFHQACIDRAFSVSMKCPLCMRFYGKPKGNQPRTGTMTTRVLRHLHLPGYQNYGVIHISYNFPSGIQGSEHPNPGVPYRGTARDAYLPDNEKGRELLLLLREAFDARLTFTVGRSVTTGQDNVVTWNDIHHKTNMTGGPQGFGYPDPTYLDRLKMELADKGITH